MTQTLVGGVTYDVMSPRPGPRRPVVCIRLAEAGIALVDEYARARGVSRSEMVRILLSEAIDARRKATR